MTCKSRPEKTSGFDEAKPLNFILQEDENNEQIGIKYLRKKVSNLS